MIETYTKQAKSVRLRDFCYFSVDGELELTRWVNGEGFDLVISNDQGIERSIHFSNGESKALMFLLNSSWN